MITLRRLATASSLLCAAFILYIGVNYLIAPEVIATGFGLPAWPSGDAVAFLNIKGIRDTVCGILVLALLALGQRFALGVTMLAMAVIPIGDMTTVLAYDGSPATALGIHGVTALLVAATGILLVTESRATATTGAQPERA